MDCHHCMVINTASIGLVSGCHESCHGNVAVLALVLCLYWLE